MVGKDVRAVKVYRNVIHSLLEKAGSIKDTPSIEPPVTEASLGGIIDRVLTGDDGAPGGSNQQTQFAAVETAFREIFYDLLVRPLQSPSLAKGSSNAAAIRPQHPSMTHPLCRYGTFWTLSQYSRITVSFSVGHGGGLSI